jgi:pSer/pThr/pTyr-binding forkhead associated (FHA) protein
MFRVTMCFGGRPVKKFTFEKTLVAIGRDATCDIVVENIGASRRHATIERTPEGYVLEDLKSHNGTFVSGEKVFHHSLRDQDEFFIGKYAFRFETLEPVAEAPKVSALSAPATDMTFRLERSEIERIMGNSRQGAATQLVQIAPQRERQTVLLDKAYHLVGADGAADVKLRGAFAPAKAAVLVKCEHGWRLLGLSRRMRVNGRHVADGPLADGDLLEVGARRFRFCQA